MFLTDTAEPSTISKKFSKTSFCLASCGYLVGGIASNKDFGGSSHGITKREKAEFVSAQLIHIGLEGELWGFETQKAIWM